MKHQAELSKKDVRTVSHFDSWRLSKFENLKNKKKLFGNKKNTTLNQKLSFAGHRGSRL